MKVGYLGPPGTFGEEAATRLGAGAELVPFSSHAAAAQAAEAGSVDASVLAIENSLNGSVAETLDILIHETSLTIQAEATIAITHYLAATAGTALADVRVVYSHPHAINQCSRFLGKALPGAQFEAALSTAEAVRLALAKGGGAAAIANLRAIELYGAEVIASGIQDSGNNVTRFVLLGRGDPVPTGDDRTSIAFWFANDRPGALAGVLNEFAARGINCSKIESRPTKEVVGEYVFLIDFDGHRDDPRGREILAAIAPLCSRVKVFGSHPKAH
ncbi:MAG: prephenate dehydratase [Dehalococcoidia bacterium]